MSYRHSMTCHTQGILAPTPVWRGFDGMVGVFWQAEGAKEASGYYLSPDPRVVVFFNDVSDHIRMSNRGNETTGDSRPMTRAVYIPAGVPMWTRFNAAHRFSHLDLHLHSDRLLKILTPSVGSSDALTAMRRNVELQKADTIEVLSRLLVAELSNPSRHAVHAESLIGSILTGLLDIPMQTATDQSSGGLTPSAMKRLVKSAQAEGNRRLTIAEMAETVGLSKSWFAQAFKQTTGQTPLQWQLNLRIERAQDMLSHTETTLADIAAQLGFADQAHLTKAFRHVTGQTPAAWRRMRQLQ